MTSKKRANWARQKAEFNASLGDMDDLFSYEYARNAQVSQRRQDAYREKSCESKNRYVSKAEAEAVIQDCADYGRTGLSCYRCDFCNGWHLTSKKYK